MAASKAPRVVLVTRLSALGDIAITVPVLYPVCNANPDTLFVLLTQPWPATMMINAPANLTVVPVDVRGKGVWAMWRLAASLREQYGIDAVADLHSVIRTWAIDARLRLTGVSVERIDKNRKARRALVTGESRNPLPTTIERYRDVFRRLGLEVPVGDVFTSILDGAPLPVSPIVPEKQAGERWVAVAPFSQHRGKVYPMERVKHVVERLMTIPGMTVFLLGGGKQEKLALREIVKDCAGVVSLAEIKHGFVDELVLLHRCDAMVTMDSANMHLASLVGLPAVSIWGATHPMCGFMGYRQSADNAIGRDDLPCRPCGIYGENPCRYGDYRCLDIDPERIVARVKEIIL